MNHRNELKKNYQMTYKSKGAFLIRNKLNGKIFVDISNDLTSSKNRLLFELKMKSSYNKLMQQEYNEAGENNFEFEVIEEIPEQEDVNFDYQKKLEELKEKYLAKFQPYDDKGYNRRKV